MYGQAEDARVENTPNLFNFRQRQRGDNINVVLTFYYNVISVVFTVNVTLYDSRISGIVISVLQRNVINARTRITRMPEKQF